METRRECNYERLMDFFQPPVVVCVEQVSAQSGAGSCAQMLLSLRDFVLQACTKL